MNHYLDIRLLPDADFAAPVLLNALYAKLHRVLVSRQETGIGVSFPLYEAAGENAEGQKQHASFGLTLRLHGNEATLTQLMETRWMSGFSDYTMTGRVLAVPTENHPIRVIRRQTKGRPDKERERLMRRKGISEADAKQLISNRPAPKLNLPFVTLDSNSTRQRFFLFIEQKTADQHTQGEFNAYGLSQTATLPAW